MAYSRPFGFDPLTGAKETIHFDDDGKIRIVKEANVESILQQNYEDRKHTSPTQWGDKWEKDGQSFVRFARIPLDVYHNEKLLPYDIRHDEKEFMKWLQKPEQEAFRARWGDFV